MSVDPGINLFVELDPELARWRRRAMFLTSVILHALLLLLILFAPDLFRRGKLMMGIPVGERPDRQVTTLWLPPDLLKALREPPPEARNLSDKNRRAQGRSPEVDPNGLHAPYSRGNTTLPEIARGGLPPPPPAAAPTPPPGGPAPSPSPPPQPKSDAGLRLEDVKPEDGRGGGRVRLPAMTPGQAVQQSLQAAARGGYHPGAGAGSGGDSALEFNNLRPNFSTEAPIILSDTRGVDFGPYLARVVYAVRRNWYAVIPESARLGEKGRVGVVFEILKDGSVPQLRLVASSGSDPLDRAAVTGIHASIPFPPLPQEFTGNHLVLQFLFLYNILPQ
ncbi:MAG: TonB family protein [Terriglobia bacterium]|jgi:TonB family protein